MPESTLTPRQVGEIFERWDSGKYTQVELGGWFGVSDGMIRKLLREREAGRDRSKEGGNPSLAEAVAEEWIAIKAIEETLGLISRVIGEIYRKPDRNERDYKELSMAKGSMKCLLDARKQLKELPKDLKAGASKVDERSIEKMVELVAPENREQFLDILKGLAQSRERPSPDLALGGKAGE